jgi:hypothetical protein
MLCRGPVRPAVIGVHTYEVPVRRRDMMTCINHLASWRAMWQIPVLGSLWLVQ